MAANVTSCPLLLRSLLSALAAALVVASAQAQIVQTAKPDLPAAWDSARHSHPKPKPSPAPQSGGDPDGTWNVNANGTWSTTTNWVGGIVPDLGGMADFSQVNITTAGGRTVTIDTTSRTVGIVKIGDTNNGSPYTINATGGASLIFDNVSLSGADTQLNQTIGSAGDTISAPVILNSSLDITNASVSTLSLTGAISGGTAGTKTITSSTGTVNINAIISNGSGPLAVTQNGPGILILGKANTFTGGFTLAGGTVNIGNANALGAGVFNITGGTMQSDGPAARALGVTQINVTGDFSIGGTNTGLLSFSGPIVLTGVRQVTDNNTSGATTFSGIISGVGGGLIKAGAGALTLSAASTFDSGVTVNSGIVQIGNSSTVAGGIITTGPVGSGTLALNDTTTLSASNGVSRTLQNSLTLSGGVTIGDATNSGALTFNSKDNSNNTLTTAATITLLNNVTITNPTAVNLNDVISGNFSLTKTGAGTLTLNGANLFTGGVTINAGIVTAGSGTALGPAANATLTFGANSTGKFQLNGNNITVVDLNTNISVGTPIIENGSGNKTLTVNTVNTDIFAGVLQDGASGTLALTKSGIGSLTLSGLNTYAGGTTLSAGTLNINSSTALGTGTLTVNGASLGNTSGNAITLTSSNNINLNAGTLTFSGPNDLSFGNNTVTMTGGDRIIAVSGGDNLTIGAIAEDTPPRNFTKNGNGNLILIGASTYTGTTTIGGNGTLQLGNGGTTGSLSTSSTITDNATLAFNRSNAVVQGTDFSGSAISGTGGSISQIGSGTLTLNVANTYTGGTTVSNGTLAIGNDNALGSGTLAITGGTITAVGGPHSIGNAATLGLGNGTIAGGNDLSFTSSFTETGGDRTLTVSNTGNTIFNALNLSGNNTGHSMTITGTGNVVLNGVVANGGTGAGSLTFDPAYAGTATINATNTYSGTTTLSSGTFVLGNKSAFGTSAVTWGGISASASTDLSGANAIANAGTLKNVNTFSGSNNIELSGILTNIDNAGGIRSTMSGSALTLSGTLNLSNNANARTFTFSGNGNTLVSGTIQDGGGAPENLVKSQGGTLQVTNVDTYTGTTTINAGTIDINSNATTTGKLAGTSNITVNAGGTLMLSNTGAQSGTDRINDAATMTLNGGTFKTGGLSEHGATNNTAGIGAVTLQSSSILNLGNGSSVIAFANTSAQIWSGTLSIYNWTGSLSGGGTDQVYFGSDTTGLSATQLADVTFYSDSGITALGIAQILADGEIVPIAAVPEPGTWVAGALLASSLIVVRRRTRVSRA